MKSEENKAPIWTWLFVILCSSIPIVALGGLIPYVLGGMGSVSCYAIARDGEGTTQRRILICTLITALCWSIFGSISWVVITSTKSNAPQLEKSNQNTVPVDKTPKVHKLSDEQKQKIYAKVARKRSKIADKKQQIAEWQSQGRNTEVLKKQLEHLKKMYENHLEFSTRFHKISSAELKAIIAQGDQAGWFQE